MPLKDTLLENLVQNKGATDQKTVNVALQHGHDVYTAKKKNADAPNRHGSGTITDPRKLEEQTEEFDLPHISQNFKLSLQRARQCRGMSQHDLAMAINEKLHTIQEYEKGTAVPKPATISKLSKALDTKLNIHM